MKNSCNSRGTPAQLTNIEMFCLIGNKGETPLKTTPNLFQFRIRMEWQVRRLGYRFELYDLENDPDEIANLADRDQYQEMVRIFCGKLKTFQKETNDPWLHKWEYE